MTTRSLPAAIMSDLAGLRERVAKATGADRELDAAIAVALGAKPTVEYGHECLGNRYWAPMNVPLYTASIDAALALVERKVPDAFWLVGRGKTRDAEPPFGCQLLFGTDEILGEGEGPTPPLAILAALLQALEQTR